MKRVSSITIVLLLAAACASPTRPSENGTISALIDGQPFQTTDTFGNITTVNGLPVLNIVGNLGPTELQILYRSPGQLTTGTELTSCHAGYQTNINQAQPTVWESANATLTLTSLTSTRVSGTFAFEGAANFSNTGGGTKVVTDGVFDVPLQN